MVVAAITGSTGLCQLSRLKKGIPIALANKESLVCSGSLITSIAKKMVQLFFQLIPNIMQFFKY